MDSWRQGVLVAAKAAFEEAGVPYPTGEPVEVEAVVVVSRQKEMKTRDVDNLLKDVLDALQGTWSGVEKAARAGVINNDVQVFRATVEKVEFEDTDARSQGSVTVRPFPSQ